MRPCRLRPGAWLLALLLPFAPAVAVAAVEVRFEGVEDEAADNVRAFAEITRLSEDDELLGERVRRLHRLAPQQIREGLEPLGYYDAAVEGRLERDGDDWIATYRIDPGEPLTYDAVDIRLLGEGADDTAFAAAVDDIGLAADDRVHHGRYERAKRELESIASRRGYFEAEWETSRLRVEPEAGRASATLHLDTGPRYRYGDIALEQDVLDADFARRYLRFAPGDPFHRRDLLDLQFALSDTPYFSRVRVNAEREEATAGRVPITVEAEARPRNRYTWGIGWGTDTGARTRLGWESRRVNRRGHRFDAEAEIAEVRQRFGLAYTIPLARPDRERLVFDTAFRQEEFADNESEIAELGARRVRQFDRWEITEGLSYERSRDDIGDAVDTRRILVPRLAAEYSRRNDSVYPTRGYHFRAEMRGAREALGSDVDFTQVRLGAQWIEEVLPRTRILLRGEWGGTEVADVNRLPLSQRFFAGGDQSVRGFAFQDLGPRNDDGDVVGGRYLTTGSVELERLLFGNWGGAVFTDVGNVGAQPDLALEQSVGLGLRWRAPVGVLRLDVAEPITVDQSPRLHLSIGVGF